MKMIIFHKIFIISIRKNVANPYPLYLCQVTIEILKISTKCKLHLCTCMCYFIGSCYVEECVVPKLNVYICVVILGSC